MGKAGHDGGRFPAGEIQQGGHDRRQQRAHGVHFGPEVQAQVGRHLVVSGSSGVQFFTHVADAADQGGFDIHVHVFQLGPPAEFSGGDFLLNRFQSVHDLRAFPLTDQFYPGKHAHVGDGPRDIVVI